ncbi:TrpB-like pyridoxal phosphate-dependent enzyme [archaeon]|nr:TrpB-like pyridoxal phosphate-dependent enzyme [archaeon]
MKGPTSLLLSPDEMPKSYYNILPDLPWPIPPPMESEERPIFEDIDRLTLLEKILPGELLKQNQSKKSWIKIPERVVDFYQSLGRPTPLVRARRLEEHLKTPAKIFIKREDTLPTGSFKLNTAIPQAYYASLEGYEKLTCATGAGQWGLALSLAASIFGMGSIVFMARASYDQKSYRRALMELYGAEVFPSPSKRTESGKMLISRHPEHPGSIGTTISEAMETALKNDEVGHTVGSTMPFTFTHQSIVGLEAKKQLEKIGLVPDTVVACTGGGSCFASIAFPFLKDKITKKTDTGFLITESSEAPRLTKGAYEYDFGDAVGLTPLTKSYTLGHEFIPPATHIGGLRHHSGSPVIALLKQENMVDTVSYTPREIFEAGRLFARLEGYVPAPETCHGIKGIIGEALKAKAENEKKVLLLHFSGSGLLDATAFTDSKPHDLF